MKRTFLFLLLVIGLLTNPILVKADGCFFIPDYTEYVYSPSQKAAIIWDGNRETMILSVKMTMEKPEDFAWVVPISSNSKPEISEGDNEIFYEITRLLSPPPRGDFWGIGGLQTLGRGIEAGVEVIEEKKIDIYDIAILRATDASVLVDWLNENAYSTPEEAIPTLQYYANQENFYFIANKINLSNKYAGMTFTEDDKICVQQFLDMEQYRYFQGHEEYIEIMLTNYKNDTPECLKASVENVKVLYSLKMGISTPLKIEFEPEKPFYPMKMTSINSGEVKVNVYLISDKLLKDASGLMDIEKMTTINPTFKEKYGLNNENYLTSLAFEDDSSKLVKDSFFEATFYDVAKDPNYVSPLEVASEVIVAVSYITLLFLMFIAPFFIVIPFAIGFGLGYITKKMTKKIRYLILILVLIAEITVTLSFSMTMAVFLSSIIIFTILGFFSLGWKHGIKKWILAAVILFLICLASLIFAYPIMFF